MDDEMLREKLEALEIEVATLRKQRSPRRGVRLRRAVGHLKLRTVLICVGVVIPTVAYAAVIAVPFTFQNGAVADADQVNANFDTVVGESNAQDGRLQALEDQIATLTAAVDANTASWAGLSTADFLRSNAPDTASELIQFTGGASAAGPVDVNVAGSAATTIGSTGTTQLGGSSASRIRFGGGAFYSIDVTTDLAAAMWIRGPANSNYYLGNSSTDDVILFNGTNLAVSGDLSVSGDLTVTGSGSNVPHACRQVTSTAASLLITASCSAGEMATGGGCLSWSTAWNAHGQPLGGSPPTGWACGFQSATSANSAYAVCCDY